MKLNIGASQQHKLNTGASQGGSALATAQKLRLDKKSNKIRAWWFK